MEFTREEKKKKAEVENAVSAGKEEMERALAALTKEHEQRIRSLEVQHLKTAESLQNQIEEKAILSGCGASSSTVRAPVCTVSEAQLRQSLAEAKEEIKAFKEQVRLKVHMLLSLRHASGGLNASTRNACIHTAPRGMILHDFVHRSLCDKLGWARASSWPDSNWN
jgi:hypothetical protein